jgi:hypothetical protein
LFAGLFHLVALQQIAYDSRKDDSRYERAATSFGACPG